MQLTLLSALFIVAITAATPLYQTALVNVEVDLKTKDTVESDEQQTTNLRSHPEPAPEKPGTLLADGDTYPYQFRLKAHRRLIPEIGPWYLTFSDYKNDTVGTITERGSGFNLTNGVLGIIPPSSGQPNLTVGYYSDATFPRKIAAVVRNSPLEFRFGFRAAPWPLAQVSLVVTNPQGDFRVEPSAPRTVSFVSRLSKRLT